MMGKEARTGTASDWRHHSACVTRGHSHGTVTVTAQSLSPLRMRHMWALKIMPYDVRGRGTSREMRETPSTKSSPSQEYKAELELWKPFEDTAEQAANDGVARLVRHADQP